MQPILAFPAWGKMTPQNIKDYLVSRAIEHRKMDEYIKGDYCKTNGTFKGCSIGCSNQDLMVLKGEKWQHSSHLDLEKHSGLPLRVGRIVDFLFETLPENHSVKLTEQVWKSITPGADLSKIWHLHTIWTLTHKKWGIINLVGEETKPHIQTISDLLKTETTRPLTKDEKNRGDSAASATWAAWAAWDASAAWDAWAAWAAWDAWAAWAAWDAYLIASKNQLIKLLKDCK